MNKEKAPRSGAASLAGMSERGPQSNCSQTFRAPHIGKGMVDSAENLKEEIKAISVYGTGSLSRLLRALSWWADDQDLRGAQVAGLANDLEWFRLNNDDLKELLLELEVERASGALDAVEALQEKIHNLERRNEILQDALDDCLSRDDCDGCED
jgi:hypothetical protein